MAVADGTAEEHDARVEDGVRSMGIEGSATNDGRPLQAAWAMLVAAGYNPFDNTAMRFDLG